jgi:hypothetical protein
MKSLYIYNSRRFQSISLTTHLWSWALPFNVERYPGSNGWTYRFRFLCFNLLIRAKSRYRQCDYCTLTFLDTDLIIEEGDLWSCSECWDRNEQSDYERSLESTMG